MILGFIIALSPFVYIFLHLNRQIENASNNLNNLEKLNGS